MADSSHHKIASGLYLVTLECPRCHQSAEIPAGLWARLTVDESGETTIRLHVTARPVDHRCGQRSLFDELEDMGQTRIETGAESGEG